MNNKSIDTPARGWHVAKWPLLAWLETVIKLAAIVIGTVALVQAQSTGTYGLPSGLRMAQFIILTLLSLGLLAAIFDRISEREIVGMVFILLNNLGHWGMVVALASEPGPGALLIAFAGLMLAGDLVKLVFLRVHNYSVRDTPPAVVFGLTAAWAMGYLLILFLELVR